MLADDDAATLDEGGGALTLGGLVEPGVGVLNIHVHIGDDGTDAKEEGGVAGDHLSVGVGAHVADLVVAVSIDVLVRDLAFIDELLQLHARDDAADIARFKDVGEGVVEVGETGSLGGVARHGDELDFGMLLSSLLGVGLVAIGVGDNQVAALLDAVDAGVVAVLVLGHVVLPDDVRIGEPERCDSLLHAKNVSVGITFVLIAYEDDADLYVTICLSSLGIANKGEYHQQAKSNSQKAFHLVSSSCYLFIAGCRPYNRSICSSS